MKLLVPLSLLLLHYFCQVNSLSGTCNSYEAEKINEGYKPRVYIDTEGHPTVGIGFNLDRSDARQRLSAVGANYDRIRAGTEILSDYQIQMLFRADMDKAVHCVSSWVPTTWRLMSNDRRSAIVDMAFNLGCAGLKKFKKMKVALQLREYDRAAYEMRNSEWCRQVKSRCLRNISCMTGGMVTLMQLLGINYP